MNNSELSQSDLKPYRYTLNKSATIIESSQGKYVVKKNKKDLFSLFNYLDSRGFDGYPKLIKSTRGDDNVFEYVDDYSPYSEQKLLDLESLLSSLHNKTVYYKNTSLDNYKEIREDVLSNIAFLDRHFNILFLNTMRKEYMSPAEQLFAKNYYKIKQSLNFCETEINAWFEMSKDNTKERVALVHNNLSLDHFLNDNGRKVFISWDNYKFDTPILDFVRLYQKEYLYYDFSEFLEKYLHHFELKEPEKKLLFTIISIPPTFDLSDNSLKGCQKVREKLDYLYKTEKLIGPYYPKEEVE